MKPMNGWTCPARLASPDPKIKAKEFVDRWVVRGPDHVCSFCGCMEPDEFISWCIRCAEPDSQVTVDLGDKQGKYHIGRRGINSSDDGAIKFYVFHFPDSLEEAVLAERHRIVGKAIEVSVARIQGAMRKAIRGK